MENRINMFETDLRLSKNINELKVAHLCVLKNLWTEDCNERHLLRDTVFQTEALCEKLNQLLFSNSKTRVDLVIRLIEYLRYYDCIQTAEFSHHWLKQHEVLVHSLQTESLSHYQPVELKCPDCGNSQYRAILKIGNTISDPDIEHRAQIGDIFQITCYYCGHSFNHATSFFYYNSDKEEYLLHSPDYSSNFGDPWSKIISDYVDSLPPELRNYKSGVMTVSGQNVKNVIGGAWSFADEQIMVFVTQRESDFLEIVNSAAYPDFVNISSLDSMLNAVKTDFFGWMYTRKNDYNKAIVFYAKGFLDDQRQVEWLFELSKILSQIGHKGKADFIEAYAIELLKALRKYGIIHTVRDFNSDFQAGEFSRKLEKEGVSSHWDISQLTNLLELIIKTFDV